MIVTIELTDLQVKAYKQLGLKNKKQIADYLSKNLAECLDKDKCISPNITSNVRRLILDNPPEISNEKEMVIEAKISKYLNN